MRKMVPLTIAREKWLRGGKNGKGHFQSPELLASNGQMCCLGFACLALGAKKEDIKGVLCPESVHITSDADLRRFKEGGDKHSTEPSTRSEYAMGCNDNEHVTEAVRERRVKNALARLGFKVRFMGSYS